MGAWTSPWAGPHYGTGGRLPSRGRFWCDAPVARVEPSRVVVALAAAGAALALLGLLDPVLRGPGLVGCALACAAAAVARRHGEAAWPVLLATAAVGFVVAAALRPEFRADAPGYYVYLRSLALDHDLDF